MRWLASTPDVKFRWQQRGGQYAYPLHDGHGSVRALSSGSGSLTDSYDYDAFGVALAANGSSVNPYRYSGEWFDPNLDQYYLRARYYAPQIGRFSQMDSWQGNNHDPITLHKYAYGNADPVNYTDPSGHFGLAEFGVANNIRMSLANMQTEFGFSILDSVVSGEVAGPSPMAMGLAVIGGAGAFKMLSMLSGKFRQACSIANSFEGDTLVATEQGLVAIQNIRIGDKVWAYNEETGERSLQPVVHLIEGEGSKEIVEISLASGEVINATTGHPFYVDGEWKDAGALAINDLLQRLSGEPLAVVGLLSQSEQTKVYNLTVANDHTYYVGESEVLAHNAGCKSPTKYNWDHIFDGDFKGVKFQGFHHREGGITPANRTVTPNGVKSGDFYEATVKGNGKPKDNISTFFPDNWTREQVKNVVNQGIILKKGKSGEVAMDKLWPGAPSNVVLKIVIHGDTLTSAYPVIKKM